jgi:hypothetical protein
VCSSDLVYETFVFLFTLGGYHIWFMTLMQLILLSFTVNQFFDVFFSSMKLSHKNTAGFISVISPFLGGYASTLWKDALSMTLLILSCTYLKKATLEKRKIDLILGIFTLAIFVSVRFEGLLVIVVLGVIITILTSASRRSVFGTIVVALLISICISNGLSSALKSQPVLGSIKNIVPLHDLAYLSGSHPEDIQLRSYIERFSIGKSQEGGNFCPNVNPFYFSEGFNIDAIDQLNPQPIIAWLKYTLQYPFEVLKIHHCRSSALLPFPISLGPKYVYFIHPGVDQNDLGLDFRPVSVEINDGILSVINFLGSIFLWPGMILTMFYLTLYFCRSALNLRDPLITGITLFPVTNSFILFLATPGQDFRYMASSTCLSILFGIGLLVSKRESNVSSQKN